ncbi:MAG: HlyC/CorC family transporter [Candidatus Rokubacteria bacterium]|nr:HlyC/CorC family transporter [Candidatus Rokubacteria bacterium]
MTMLWVAALCLVAVMFFSAAEMAFIAANRLRLRHAAEEGNRTAARYLEAFRHPERALSAAMMGVTIAHIAASSTVTWTLLPTLGGLAPVLVTVLLTPVMLVFGEIIPKAVAREWATNLILKLYWPLTWASVVLVPFVGFSRFVVARILRLFGGREPDVRAFVSREELKALLSMEPGEADVTTQEAEMIDKIFDLGDTTVREVMVPLVEVAMLPDTASPGDAIALIRERGFSRIPLYRQRETNVVGVVAAMDLLSRGAAAATLDELKRQPYYVPETKRIDDLLREMQRARTHMAVVVDEYGGSTGVVTLEDILEEIVGEIRDEHDRAPAAVERLPDGSYLVAARTNIDELNEALDWSLPKEDYETVAGLVLATLHRIPRTGEEFQIPGYTITVLEADVRRVAAVKIAPAPGPGAHQGGS